MPITPSSGVNPTTMTNNWAAGLQSPLNQQKLVTNYNNPKRLFNYDPIGQQADWQTGIQRASAANKYATGMANANLNQASANMTQYGGQNWATAGTSKKYKYAAKATNLAAAINAVSATVDAMPKGKGANNQARMIAWSNGMAAYYGKI
jgi:hypothetical protein